GPMAGFVFLAAALGVTFAIVPFIEDMQGIRWLDFVLGNLIFINLIWGMVNLLPIFPLDVGQISREVFCAATPRNGMRYSLALSLGLAATITAVCALVWFKPELGWWMPFDPVFMGLLFGLLAFENYQALQRDQEFRRHWRDDGW